MKNKYITNPKTFGSGIFTAIPQKGNCKNGCKDCFFTSGRSYLEPLKDNLPNMPNPKDVKDFVVRVNDGNDSNIEKDLVIKSTKKYKMKFYNTSIPDKLEEFDAPVVLTVNPKDDKACFLLNIPTNLMMVRARVNMWNLDLIDRIVDYYSKKEISVILTFMAYFKEDIPENYKKYYVYRKRTLNSYWAITTKAWEKVMKRYKYNKWVYSCGKIEGEKGITKCRHCGNCLREYFACINLMKDVGNTIK